MTFAEQEFRIKAGRFAFQFEEEAENEKEIRFFDRLSFFDFFGF